MSTENASANTPVECLVRRRLRQSQPLPLIQKPDNVAVGQIWRHRGTQGRELVVIEIVKKHGCCPLCVDNPSEPWAKFRKGKQDVVHHMLDPRSTWTFHGYAF